MRRLIIGVTLLLAAAPAWAASVTLEWTPVTGATGYDIEQSTDTGVTQLPLFSCHDEEPRGVIRPARSYEGVGGRLRTAPAPGRGPSDAFQEAGAALPAGVLDFPTPPVGAPAYEAFGLIVVDAPRGVARSLRAQHRRAGDR